MRLLSPAFENGEKIPSLYTCDGKNINPPLKISNVPENSKTLVLIMDDPDVPKFVREDGMWVHLVLYDIPPTIKEIPENSTLPGTIGAGTGNKKMYQGPCPPDREHRYFFKLYALDIALKLPSGATKEEVEKKMKGHIIEEAVLMGRYQRKL